MGELDAYLIDAYKTDTLDVAKMSGLGEKTDDSETINRSRRMFCGKVGRGIVSLALVPSVLATTGCEFYDQNFDVNGHGTPFKGVENKEPEPLSEDQVKYLYNRYLETIKFPLSFDDFLTFDETDQKVKCLPSQYIRKRITEKKLNVELFYSSVGLSQGLPIEFTDNDQNKKFSFTVGTGFIVIQNTAGNTVTGDAEILLQGGNISVRYRFDNDETFHCVVNSNDILLESEYDEGGKIRYSYRNLADGDEEKVEINGIDSLLEYLNLNGDCEFPISTTAGNWGAKKIHANKTEIDIKDIESIDQLFDIYSHFINDPEGLSSFLLATVKYKKGDKSLSDEYRKPLDSLKSGWADCDDFSILTGFWARLHDFETKYVEIPKHVFTMIKDADGNTHIFDNSYLTTYTPEIDDPLDEYMKSTYPNDKVENIIPIDK